MKNEDKKVPDAPDRLFVFPCHTGLTCGLLDPDGKKHDGYPVWQGMAVRATADDVLYINYSDIPYIKKLHPRINTSEGWGNKMFVKSDLMPHQIKITNIRCERLQYISTDDCMKEGICCCHMPWFHDAYSSDATNDSKRKKWWYQTPIEAYKMLSCKLHLHWDSNPLVFVYDFKLVK